MSREHLGRWIFSEGKVSPGYIVVEEGVVDELCLGTPPPGSRRSLIIPAFVNAHTHIGDSVAYPAPKGTVERTVGPGGYKTRALASASAEEKAEAMRASIAVMDRCGTSAFVDYREEGLEGVRALKAALEGSPVRGVVLGRPAGAESTARELEEVASACDGLALSALSDWDAGLLRDASEICHRSGRTFSLHASEVVREDIDRVLDLDPDFLVHMNAATDDDLLRCVEEGVPLVVCPRSNGFFGIPLDIPRLLRLGLHVALGTDNAMISEPDMLSELRAAFSMSVGRGGVTPEDALVLATLSGRKVLNAKGKITTELCTSDDLVVIDVQGEDPLLELVSSAGHADVAAVVRSGRVRRRLRGGDQEDPHSD